MEFTDKFGISQEELQERNEEVKNAQPIDQHILAKSVSDNIKYDMLKEILVKPLDPIMIEREFDVPVTDNTVDDDGLEINEYQETKKEIKSVPSVFERGIVLKTPPFSGDKGWGFEIGDTIVYNGKFAVEFDLLKDSKLIKPYDVVAVEK